MRLRRAIFHCARSCVCGGGGCLDRRRRCRTLAGAHRKLGRRTDKPLTERSDALCGCSRYGCAGSLACGEFGCSSVYRSVCAATWRAGMERIVRTRRGNAHVRCGIACRSGTGCGCVGCTDCACVCVDCPTGTHASCVGGDGAFRWANRSGLRRTVRQCRPVTLGGTQRQQACARRRRDLAAARHCRVEPNTRRCHARERHCQPFA